MGRLPASAGLQVSLREAVDGSRGVEPPALLWRTRPSTVNYFRNCHRRDRPDLSDGGLGLRPLGGVASLLFRDHFGR